MIGTTLGHYGIVEKIGAGGMGVVYRAHDERLDRDVAIKVLREEVAADPDRLRRFQLEARVVARLDHPNILAIHDLGSDQGVSYAVMELLKGVSLREVISRVGLTAGKALEYAKSIADGLAAAHDSGVIHRDLKPENVFLTRDGRIKILDFGLAKLKLPEADLTTETPTKTLDTAPGGLLGTVAYMAPEQVQGQPADHRSDVFALGVMLYEMLTGHRPFGGSTSVETATAILKEDPEPIFAAAPGVPPTLAGVVSKCLEKRPEDRFNSAHDLALTLAAIDTGASAPPAGERSVISKRWPHILAVVIAAVIALLVILPPEALFERQADPPADVPLPRIVVLPFENLGSPDDEYFADGMTEEIISRLAVVSGLQVISRTSAIQYKGTDKTIRQIGEELDVQYVLEGTVRWERAGEGHGRVRITPQLIKVSDDSHLWSDRYDRAIESVFEVQSDIAQQVVGQLHVSLLEPEKGALNTRMTDNPEAYEAYLRGQRNIRLHDFNLNKLAVTMFERAVELDPDFAVAWASLSDRHSEIFHFGDDRTPERRDAARRAVDRALELDPDLPEVRLALAFYYYRCDRDFDRALEEFSRVLAISPNDTYALRGRAWILRRQGHWEEAAELLERVLALSPRDSNTPLALSQIYRALRDFRKAKKYADLTISLAPDLVDGYVTKWEYFYLQGRWRDARAVLDEVPTGLPMAITHFNQEFAERRFEEALVTLNAIPEAVFEQRKGERGAGLQAMFECHCYFFLGDQRGVEEACGRARFILEEQTKASPDNEELHQWLGAVYATLGRKDDAIREGELAVALVKHDAPSVSGAMNELALIHAFLGHHDEAIEQIEYLLSSPSALNVGFLREHPYWDPLRDHPRFQALLEKYDSEG